jgi:hypothetical protein
LVLIFWFFIIGVVENSVFEKRKSVDHQIGRLSLPISRGVWKKLEIGSYILVFYHRGNWKKLEVSIHPHPPTFKNNTPIPLGLYDFFYATPI